MTRAAALPDGTVGDAGACRSCSAPIVWIITAKGKRAPMNPDGTSHWSSCPDAAAWRDRMKAKVQR